MKVLYLEWIDAVASAGWSKPDEHDAQYVKTVGFLVRETDIAYSIAACVSGEECNSVISVPKAWIKRKKVVKL